MTENQERLLRSLLRAAADYVELHQLAGVKS